MIPIKSKTLDKVREQALKDAIKNSPFEENNVEVTKDTIIFKGKNE